MPFIRCVPEASYCHRLQDAIDAGMEVLEDDPGLQSYFFARLYTSLYLVHDVTHRIKALELQFIKRRTRATGLFASGQSATICCSSQRSMSSLSLCACVLTKSRGSSHIMRAEPCNVCMSLQCSWSQRSAISVFITRNRDYCVYYSVIRLFHPCY